MVFCTVAIDENTWTLLARRERELTQRIAAREAENAKDSHELDELRRAMRVLDAARMAITRDIVDKDVAPGGPAPTYDTSLPPTRARASPDLLTSFQSGFLEPQKAEVLEPDIQQYNSPEPSVTLDDVIVGVANVKARLSRSIAEAADRYPFLEFEHFTIKELIVKALTDHYKQGAGAADLVEFIKNAYGRAVERSSLSPQLSRLKQDGWVEQQADGAWNLTNEKRTALVLFDHPTSQKSMTEPLRKE